MAPRGAGRKALTLLPLRIGTPLTLLSILYRLRTAHHHSTNQALHWLFTIDKPSERSPLATNSYLISIKAPRAVVHPVSANPSPGRAHDPSWGIWPYTVLKSRTTCEQLPVLLRSPRKEIMMSRSRQEPDLANSTSPRHVTDLQMVSSSQGQASKTTRLD